ncbi:MAG: Fe-S cluster assembly protein SufD [Kiloniellaceae bacterium]
MSGAPAIPAAVRRLGAHEASLGASGMPWLRALREGAMEHFAATGLPTPRLESWKYTNLRPLEKVGFAAARSDSVGIDRLPTLFPHGHGGHRLVFVNGWFRPDLSATDDLRDGVQAGSLAAALERVPDTLAEHLGRIGDFGAQPMLALNTAMMADGFVLRVRRGVAVDLPIEVVYVGAAPDAPLAYHPRNLIVLEPGSRATIVEHHAGLGDGTYFVNSGSEIAVGDGARLHHYKVQAETAGAFHLSTVQANVARDGVYDGFVLTRGARLSRNEVTVRLQGAGAECHLNGVYMLRGEQHCDTTTVIDHLAPRTSSREVFKGAIDDRARGVFQGRIVIHPDAQKSDGHQLSKALLLSDRAEIDAKPELEIYADDVKCSHGAAAGDLDPDALFYLRARGIPEEAARHMLIEAFLSDTINELAAEGLCPALMSSVGHWLSDVAGRSER